MNQPVFNYSQYEVLAENLGHGLVAEGLELLPPTAVMQMVMGYCALNDMNLCGFISAVHQESCRREADRLMANPPTTLYNVYTGNPVVAPVVFKTHKGKKAKSED